MMEALMSEQIIAYLDAPSGRRIGVLFRRGLPRPWIPVEMLPAHPALAGSPYSVLDLGFTTARSAIRAVREIAGE